MSSIHQPAASWSLGRLIRWLAAVLLGLILLLGGSLAAAPPSKPAPDHGGLVEGPGRSPARPHLEA
jgi:hypothetical protein